MDYQANQGDLIRNYLKHIGLSNTLLVISALFIAPYLWKFIKKTWVRQMKFFEVAATLPGPPAVPLLGNALLLVKNTHDILNTLSELMTKYRPRYHFWMGPKLFIITADPNDIKIILSNQHSMQKGDIYHNWSMILGDSLIYTKDSNYKLRRKAVLATMNSETLTSFIDIYDRYSEKCANALESELNSGEFNTMPFLVLCINDIVRETVLCVSADSEKEVADEIAATHQRIYQTFFEKMMCFWYHVDFIFCNTKVGRECWKVGSQFRGYVQGAITKSRREWAALGNSNAEEQKSGIMKQMVDWLEEKNLVPEKTLLDDMTTVYLASLDPLCEISCFILDMLAMHQDVQDKVRQEVVKVVGKGRVEMSCLGDLKYLEMVIKETIRLFPIAPLMARKLTGEIQLDSYCLPEGSTVLAFAFMLHRSPEHWERPEEFIPERFLPENSAKRHPHAYIPFSYGLKSCVGQKFAILCLKTVVANLVRRFRFATTRRLEDIELQTDITIRPRNGHRLSISRV